MSSPPLILAITANQAITEKILNRRGHAAKIASESRTQYIHGHAVERQVNLLGNMVAIPEPDDYRDVLDATGIICLVTNSSGEPLRVPAEGAKGWYAWIDDMEKRRQQREVERNAQRASSGGPPCDIGDRVIVRWSSACSEEGTCEWIGKKYLRISPLHGAGNVITAPFSLVVRSADDELEGRAASVAPARRRGKRGGRSRWRRRLEKSAFSKRESSPSRSSKIP